MTIDEIKAISIKDYLGSMSIYPTKNYGYYGMYKSPFRNEHTPSFKVDYNQNLVHPRIALVLSCRPSKSRLKYWSSL